MPLMACMENNRPGYKYGQSGHCYTYSPGSESARKEAKRKAILQGTAIVQTTGEKLIIKTKLKKEVYDDDNNLVFGWGYVAIKKNGKQVIDWSEDRIEPEHIKDLEMAVYGFNVGGRKSGIRHGTPARGYLIESMMFTKEKLEKMKVPEGTLPEGVWLGFWFPDDKDYKFIKKMKSPMFSMEGIGIREEV